MELERRLFSRMERPAAEQGRLWISAQAATLADQHLARASARAVF